MNVYLDMVGCRLNQAELERLGQDFRAAGHTLVDSAALADLVVINSCSVTTQAAADSRQKIRQAARAGDAQIIVTGCWATMEPSQAASLPQVLSIIPNACKDDLLSMIPGLPAPYSTIDKDQLIRQILPGSHGRTRAFIKCQDGCNRFCTYCMTRLARGASRSEPVERILQVIRAATAGGAKEIVLTGVQLGAWGQDFSPPLRINDLIKSILDETDVPRIRISSIEPWDLNESFFELWQNDRLCPQLHLPLQSGCAATLKRMGRMTSPLEYARMVDLARAVKCDMAITTDIMVGFPGETDEEFAESMAFIEKIEFAHGHIFSFSPRPGTPAAQYPNQVDPKVKKARSMQLRALINQSPHNYRQKHQGSVVEVLWETSLQKDGGYVLEGWSGNYLHVSATHPQNLWNEISSVRLIDLNQDGFFGEIV